MFLLKSRHPSLWRTSSESPFRSRKAPKLHPRPPARSLHTPTKRSHINTPKTPKKKKHKNTSSKTYTLRNWKTFKAEELRTCGSRSQDEEHEEHQERKQVDARHRLPPHRGLLVRRVVDLVVVAHVHHNRSHLFFLFFF
jgi:hypothetical protein